MNHKFPTSASLCVAALALAACGTASSNGNGVSTLSPTNAEAVVTQAILHAHSVHMVIAVTQGGSTTTQTFDSNQQGGRRVVTINGQNATILVTPKAAYLDATAPILTANFGLSSTVAAHDSGKWLSLPAGSSGYTSLANGVTIANLAQAVAISKVTRKAHVALNGVAVTELDGTSVGGKLAIVVPVVGTALPLEGSISGSGITVSLKFSHWGETVDLTPPGSSTPFPASALTSPPTTTATAAG